MDSIIFNYHSHISNYSDDINKNIYVIGLYKDICIIITNNKYINITDLCKKYHINFEIWKEKNKEIIEIIKKEILIIDKYNDVFLNRNCRYCNECNGIYMHELLIPYITPLISEDVEFKINKIIKASKIDITIYEDKFNKLTNQYNELLVKGDELLDEIFDKVIKLNNKYNELEKIIDKITDDNISNIKYITKINNQLALHEEKLDIINMCAIFIFIFYLYYNILILILN